MQPFARLSIACLLLGLASCSAPPRNFVNDNDRLREENLLLRRQVDTLEKNVAERLAEISAMEQRLASEAGTIEGARIPALTSLRFGRYTSAIDTDADGRDDTVRVYLLTLDQESRFLPVAGRAVLTLTAITPDAGATVIATRTFEPADLDRAYRSGFTGTHYTLDLPLPDDLPADLTQLTLKAFVTDAATGVTLEHEKPLPLRATAP